MYVEDSGSSRLFVEPRDPYHRQLMALNERTATNVGPSSIEISYERRGEPTDPVVLLIMGGAAQLVHWPDGFLAALLHRG